MVVFTSFPPPEIGIHCKQEKTKAYIQERCYGDGTIYIAEERLSWVGSSGQGFSLEYPSISLHAVSRDLSSFPSECLYLMIDQDISDAAPPGQTTNGVHNGPSNETPMDGGEGEESPDEETDATPMSEVRFVPDDKGKLDAMYGAMNECQVLHPDEGDDLDDEYYGGDGDAEDFQLSTQGQRTLQHLESIFHAAGDDIVQNEDHNQEEVNEQGEAMESEPQEEPQFEDAD